MEAQRHRGIQREKRNFSRVDENVFLEYQQARDRSKFGKVVKPAPRRNDDQKLDKLDQINTHIRELLVHVRENDIHTARCLAAINKKLDMITTAITRRRTERTIRFSRRVNLSAGGVGFRSASSLVPGARLAMRVNVPDFDLQLSTLGEVVYCVRDDVDTGFPFRVGVKFPALSMSERQALFSHVLSRYVEKIRDVKLTDTSR